MPTRCNRRRPDGVLAYMKSINEVRREPSPAGRPQGLAFLAGSLYLGSLDAGALYEIDAASWQVRAKIPAPGKPYGLAILGEAVRVVVSIGADDDRYLYSFVPRKGFDEAGKIALPDLSGSHLASDGSRLYLLQMGKRQIVALDADGTASRIWPLPQRIAGIGFLNGALYGLAGDEEFEHLHFARIDLAGAQAVVSDVASISDEARSLTHDGRAWWTSYRDESQIGSFTIS